MTNQLETKESLEVQAKVWGLMGSLVEMTAEDSAVTKLMGNKAISEVLNALCAFDMVLDRAIRTSTL